MAAVFPLSLLTFPDDQSIPETATDAHLEILWEDNPLWPESLGTLYKTYRRKRNALLKEYYLKQMLIVAKDDGSDPAIFAVSEDYQALVEAQKKSKIKTWCIVTPGKPNVSELHNYQKNTTREPAPETEEKEKENTKQKQKQKLKLKLSKGYESIVAEEDVQTISDMGSVQLLLECVEGLDKSFRADVCLTLVPAGYYAPEPGLYGYFGCTGPVDASEQKQKQERPKKPKREMTHYVIEIELVVPDSQLPEFQILPRFLHVTPGGRGQRFQGYSRMLLTQKTEQPSELGVYAKPFVLTMNAPGLTLMDIVRLPKGAVWDNNTESEDPDPETDDEMLLHNDFDPRMAYLAAITGPPLARITRVRHVTSFLKLNRISISSIVTDLPRNLVYIQSALQSLVR